MRRKSPLSPPRRRKPHQPPLRLWLRHRQHPQKKRKRRNPPPLPHRRRKPARTPPLLPKKTHPCPRPPPTCPSRNEWHSARSDLGLRPLKNKRRICVRSALVREEEEEEGGTITKMAVQRSNKIKNNKRVVTMARGDRNRTTTIKVLERIVRKNRNKAMREIRGPMVMVVRGEEGVVRNKRLTRNLCYRRKRLKNDWRGRLSLVLLRVWMSSKQC
mmetsp:Transcript_32765/g.55745  ORF Transcript_32765/g.55745 Transcript_32765/m.55745 type:complete len:215 (+) Transcript_32765:457-1101(+)